MQFNSQDAVTLLVAAVLIVWALRAVSRLLQALVVVAVAFIVLSALSQPGNLPEALHRQLAELLPYIQKAWAWIQEVLRGSGAP